MKNIFLKNRAWGPKAGIFEKKMFFIFKIIFVIEKKKLRNFLDHHIDVEFCQESISGN